MSNQNRIKKGDIVRFGDYSWVSHFDKNGKLVHYWPQYSNAHYKVLETGMSSLPAPDSLTDKILYVNDTIVEDTLTKGIIYCQARFLTSLKICPECGSVEVLSEREPFNFQVFPNGNPEDKDGYNETIQLKAGKIKVGDIVKIIDLSDAAGIKGETLYNYSHKHSTGYINNAFCRKTKYVVVATDVKGLPSYRWNSSSEPTENNNNTILQNVETKEIVFAQKRFIYCA